MNKATKFSISIFAIAIGSIFISEFSTPAIGFSDGAPAGRTGSPGDGVTCAASGCHSGAPVTPVTDWITTDIPSAGYMAGSTYIITATLDKPGHSRFGFEISPQDVGGTLLGTLTATSLETKLVGSKYITHDGTKGGTTGTDMKTWTFDWTAPATGNGPVTFYGAFNAAGGATTAFGDSIFTSSTVVSEDPTTVGIEEVASANITVYPNPVADNLNVSNAAGGIVTITDANGKVINTVQAVSNNEAVDVSALAPGIYLVSVQTENGTVTKKIIKK